MPDEEHVPAYVREHGPLQLPLRVIHLANEIGTLKQEAGSDRDKRLARTLAKEGQLRLVLTVMRAGDRLQEHQTEGALALQCIEGSLRLHTQISHPIDLRAGELVALDGGVTHSVEAVTECAFLLTVAQ